MSDAARAARQLVTVTVAAAAASTSMSVVASVWVLSLTASPSLAALCGVCVYAPTLLGPLLGTVVDRLPPRRLLIGTCLALAATLVSLVTVRSTGQLWLIYAVMVCYGVSHVVIDASEASVVQAVVPTEQIGGLNGRRLGAQESMKLLAPLGAAGLFAIAGGPAVALVSAAALVLVAWLYRGIAVPARGIPPGRTRLLRDTWEGLRFLAAHPGIRVVVLFAGVGLAGSGLCDAATLAVVVHDLHRPAAFAGALSAAQGAGSIVGGLLGGRLLGKGISETALARTGLALLGTGLIGLCLPWTLVILLAKGAVGIGLPWTVLAAMTAILRHAEPTLVGRVVASATTAIFAPVALTIPLGAALVTLLHHRWVLVLATTAVLAVASIRQRG